jgi:hypothetical protein
MPSNLKIVLFEDNTDTRTTIFDSLKKRLDENGGGVVVPFAQDQFTEPASDKGRMYDERLEAILTKSPYDSATLVLADRDLSKSQDFGGLSVSAVTAACGKLFIPICSYARLSDLDKEYDWRGRWEEGHIVLRFSDGENELARRAIIAAKGFSKIAEELPQVVVMEKKSPPAKILATLLGKPDYSDKIALYAVGDQNRLPGAIPKTPSEQHLKRLTHFLGYWLWDSLLRYPGLLVNEIAAGSYLNILTDDFKQSGVQALFNTALFAGPFADPKKPQWWRGMLDDIVSSGNYADGLELVRDKIDPKISQSRCCVDNTKPAGYYCIISEEPVSLENSKGGLSWFPRGADLTRVSTLKFEEYGPWLGT